MNGKLEAAIDKLRDEMAGEQQSPLCVVGETLTGLLRILPETAEKILEKDKTLSGAMAAMKDAARKTAKNGMACLDFWSGMRIVLEYFGIEGVGDDRITSAHRMMFETQMQPGFAAAPEEKTEEKPEEDALDLDALLAAAGGM